VNKYNPNFDYGKKKEPNYSQPKSPRFYKPSSVANLQAQLPSQYHVEQKPKYAYNDMMGAGKRWTLNVNKDYEMTPGPGQYSNIDLNTIKMNAERSQNGGQTNSRLGFGTTREQNDKLQSWGQERHFLGRGDPGKYHNSVI